MIIGVALRGSLSSPSSRIVLMKSRSDHVSPVQNPPVSPGLLQDEPVTWPSSGTYDRLAPSCHHFPCGFSTFSVTHPPQHIPGPLSCFVSLFSICHSLKSSLSYLSCLGSVTPNRKQASREFCSLYCLLYSPLSSPRVIG